MADSTEPLLGQPRRATVFLASPREHLMLEGEVQIDGPWVHVRGVRQGQTREYRSEPGWEPSHDVSLGAGEVKEVRWDTPRLRPV